MTIDIVVLLIAFAALEWKLKGMQWVGFLLGGWLATATLTGPERGVLGDLWVDSLGLVQEIVQKISDALGSAF